MSLKLPHTKDTEGPPDLINTEGTHEQNVQNDLITQPTDIPSGNNTEVSGSITESLVPDVTQSHISNQASISSHPVPRDRWSRDQHIELVNIIGYPGKSMLTRSMASKLTAFSASECLFADFLFKIEPKNVFEALKHPGWVDAMQEELNQFYRNKVWTLVPLPYEKTTAPNSQEEGNDYDETFAPVARMESIQIFLAFATYMNFKVYQMDVKSAFLNGKLKEEVYVKQPPGFESSEFPDYVYKLDKALYGLKQALRACPMCKISDQSKRVTSNSCEKNPQLPERKKAPQVPVKYLVENWFVRVPRNSSQWLCPQLRLNMLFLGAIIYNDLVTKLLNKSRLKYVSYPSKVTDIELTAHMIVVNNQKDSVSLLPLATKPKKGKSQTVTQTLPKSQGSEVPGALSKKRKRPKSKNPPTKTKVTPPRPTKGSEQSYSVSLGTVHDPQDLERNIQLASMGLPSILDARPRKQLCREAWLNTRSIEGTGAKYQVDQTRSTRLRYQSLPKNKGKPSHEGELDTQPIVLSIYADVRAFLLSDDEIEEDIFGAGEEIDEEPPVASIAETYH
ncbi:retrovirus-related pol polyprotein from transposon TNT 1-94 [Tanacetum coccineum]